MNDASDAVRPLDVEQKRALLAGLLREKLGPAAASGDEDPERRLNQVLNTAARPYLDYTYDMFMNSVGAEMAEVDRFNQWVESARHDGIYAFESPRLSGQQTEVLIERETGERLRALNFSSYNYLGYGHHPEVIAAAKDALDRYGLGAASAPVTSGTFDLHKRLERALTDFLGLEGRGVSLFSSGYGVSTGTISACMKPGGYVVLDRSAHMCMLEGAKLSGAKILYYRHNDVDHLRSILKRIADGRSRILVGTEGVYSADGDQGRVAEILEVAHAAGAKVMVDEAHSMLVAGPNGRGVSEAQGVLADVDFLVVTFSKAFGGVGGALIARQAITQYVNWYARCRMFSCALDPAVAGGMIRALELAGSEDGRLRRQRIVENAETMRALLRGKVNIGESSSWVIPVIYGPEKLTLPLNDHLQRCGLDSSIMQFPATPKNEGRIRLFITSEHTKPQLDRAAEIIVAAADKFGFRSA